VKQILNRFRKKIDLNRDFVANKSTYNALNRFFCSIAKNQYKSDFSSKFFTWVLAIIQSATSYRIGTYGLTTLRMDNGEKYELPKQILQLQKTHALVAYKKYCAETDVEGLGDSKLYDILNSIKPAQQQAVAGLDEFVVEGVEAWRSLSSTSTFG
jgi:hypothetical protein